jgi:hypothetical protein
VKGLLNAPVLQVSVVPFKYWTHLIGIRFSVVDVRIFEREWPAELVMPTEIDREVVGCKVIVMGLDKTIT